MEADVHHDYFSTVVPDGVEPIALVQSSGIRADLTATIQVPRREPFRPIVLPRNVSAGLIALYPREGKVARLVGTFLTVALAAGLILTMAWLRPAMSGEIRFDSSSLNAAMHALDRLMLPVETRMVPLAKSVLDTPLIRRWLPDSNWGSGRVAVELAIASGAIGVFFLGREMSGSFGGLLATLLHATSVLTLQPSSSSIFANSAGLVGLVALTAAWRRRGPIAAIFASLCIGVAADLNHAEVLLFLPLLIVCVDLPWRWAWLMLLSTATPIAGLLWCDAHFYGVRYPFESVAMSAVDLHRAIASIQFDPRRAELMLLTLAVIGVGLIVRTSGRWGVLILSWCLPAVGLVLLRGIAADQRVILFSLPPMILATVWLISRSAVAGGILVGMMGVLWVHSIPQQMPVVTPAVVPVPAVKTMSPNDALVPGFIDL